MDNQPNILLILADDLGYSDIGCFGSEIQTPNLDQLAAEGARMTDFHATAACSPTRAILLSGTDNHIAGVGCMSEMKASGGERWNVKGHEGFLNHDVAALPELLRDGGYQTLLSGKWHLGLKPQNNPAARGFERSLALLPGCSNHYGFEPQFGKDHLDFFDRIPPLYSRDGKREEFNVNTDHSSEGFYSTDTYADNLIRYFKDREACGEKRPFFAYLPFSAPHWPLQCSPEDRDRYRGMYDQGPDDLRDRRLASMKAMGLVESNVKPHPVLAGGTEWAEMSGEERKLSARTMETYAGMVTAMDRAIGRVIDHLRSSGVLNNTLVIFMSDNGAEGAAYEALPVLGKNLMTVIDRYYDNSLANIGNHNSFVWYGPRWAQAATAPHRMYKMYSTEGGIRVPFLLRYPGFSQKLQGGAILRAFGTVMDLAPTILQLAGIEHPVPSRQSWGTWKGREVAGMRGKSWLDFFKGSVDSSEAIHTNDDPAMGWELFGRAALRKGQWKILNVEEHAGGRTDRRWQLYDVVADPGETRDLAGKHPEKLKELLCLFDQYVKETGTVWGEEHPIGASGSGWNSVSNDIIGGDPLEQTRAWMQIKHGQKLPLPVL